jgi:lactate permease
VGLGGAPAVDRVLSAEGVSLGDLIATVGGQAAMLHGLIGTFIPLLLIAVITQLFGTSASKAEGLNLWKFALMAGLAFTVPYTLTAVWLGPEFPAMIGGLVGLAITVAIVRRGWLQPQRPWQFPPEETWPERWSGSVVPSLPPPPPGMTVVKAWLPYVLLGVLLVLSRLTQLPLKGWLQGVEITWIDIFATTITATSTPLYLPATMFLLVVAMTYVLHQMKPRDLKQAVARSLPMLQKTALALGSAVLMARVFINSDINGAGLPSMPLALAEGMSALAGESWPLFAGMVGTVGSFVAGSVTVSNMMFSLFQFGVAENTGLPSPLILALQTVGASAGNVICVSNVVAAAATVGLLGREGLLIRQLLPVVIYYLGAAGLLGLVWATVV